MTIPWFELHSLALPVPFAAKGEVLELRTFPLLVITGIGVSFALLHRRLAAHGEDSSRVTRFFATVLGCALVTAHLINGLLYEPDGWRSLIDIVGGAAPLHWPLVGLSSTGGFLGAAIGVAIWKRFSGDEARPLIDAAAYSFPFGWMFGRLGCFLVHDHPGAATDFVLAIDSYEAGAPPFVARHDLGLYELVWAVGCAATFLAARRLHDRLGPLAHLKVLVLSYAPVRFMLDFLRASADEGGDPRLLGLTPAQYFCALIFLGGLWSVRAVATVPVESRRPAE